jgi:hypothetical protein
VNRALLLHMRQRVLASLATLALLLALASPTPAAESCPQPFRVTYAVEWRGFGAGTSVLQLEKRSENEFVYTSSNRARGVFRLALPDTITQTSHFAIEDGTVVPSRYVGDDGSSDTSRDVSLTFDWEAGRVTGTAENKRVDQPVKRGVQDSLSVQIALMCALAEGRTPSGFQLIDKDEVKEYTYTREREETLDTPLGKLETVVFLSQKAGSSRATRMWIAPALGYVPARAEQTRRGKREFLLQIRSFERPGEAGTAMAQR